MVMVFGLWYIMEMYIITLMIVNGWHKDPNLGISGILMAGMITSIPFLIAFI